MVRKLILLSLFSALSGCKSFTPKDYDENICDVVSAGWGWKEQLRSAQSKYQVPPALVLSVIFHESSFKSDARPKQQYILGFIPYKQHTAYGYGQIKNETWDWYKSHHPGLFQSRTSFADSVDFIGWYYQLFIERSEHLDTFSSRAKHFYYAYHEGLGGYSRKTYEEKAWLQAKAQRVADRAIAYDRQLKSCL